MTVQYVENNVWPTLEPVHASIQFGMRILQIPTCEELGIPSFFPGLADVQLNPSLGSYTQNVSRCYVNRGDLLVQYRFDYFKLENQPWWASDFKADPILSMTFAIRSPVAGLVVDVRPEQTMVYNECVGLRYYGCSERRLPVILMPLDEPTPDNNQMYTYNSMSRWINDSLLLIATRDYSHCGQERLKDNKHWPDRDGASFKQDVQALRDFIDSDRPNFVVRDINPGDNAIVEQVQKYRTQDLRLRDKLVHIARAFGECA